MKKLDIAQSILIILLILFGLFIAYQLIRKILGNSWSAENLIVGLLMLNIGLTIALTMDKIKINMKLNYLIHQFRCLGSVENIKQIRAIAK